MEIGTRIGPYLIIRVLGQGGMGIVYEAMHEAISRRVALKLLNPEYASSPEAVQRLFNEARAVNLIEHPGLVQISDVGKRTDGTPYLVMELLDGQSLAEHLHRDEKLSLNRAIQISRQVADVLVLAHEKGIVHRNAYTFSILCFDVRYMAIQRRRNRDDIFTAAIGSSG